MPGCGLYHNKVSGLDALAGSVHVDALAGVLETDLEVAVPLLLGYALEGIIYLKLAAALTVAYIFFSRFLVCHNRTAAEAVELD